MHGPRRWFPGVLTVLALGGCGGAAPGQLVALDDAGDDCPDGGVAIRVGTDDDGDGAHSGAEVDSVQVVCDGSDAGDGDDGDDGDSGDAPLIETVTLEPGDPDCPFGGTRLQVGFDDGAGGGTAGDGVLQDGEIDDTEATCNGAPAFDVALLDPPAEPGAFQLSVAGGDGTSRCGGDGGEIVLGDTLRQDRTGLPGRNVVVYATGSVDASFTVPTVTVDLGDAPLEVTTDLAIPVIADGDCDGTPDSDPAVGAAYQTPCDFGLWTWDGSERTRVTGFTPPRVPPSPCPPSPAPAGSTRSTSTATSTSRARWRSRARRSPGHSAPPASWAGRARRSSGTRAPRGPRASPSRSTPTSS